MNPAFSVIFFTTLSGAGQGLFLVLFGIDVASALHLVTLTHAVPLFIWGSMVCLVLTGLGLLASFLHLGHPERAWRAATMWRTSWLSREVIALPFFMLAVLLYGVAHLLESPLTLALGVLGVVLCVALYICTGMIYACIRFLQEWASPLTLVNYFLLGSASGCTLATALVALIEPALMRPVATIAMVLTLMGCASRVASLVRNRRLKPKSTIQTALGIHHPKIVQKSQGFMGGSYNTREFFHGQTPRLLRSVKWSFLLCAFALPLLMLGWGMGAVSARVFCAAFLVQYVGLLAERWFFFAQANHPQNLYYQTIS